jgi:ferredoxin
MCGKSGEKIMKIINKKNISPLLDAAKKAWTVYAPQKFTGEDMMFAPVGKDSEVVLGNEDTVISPKDIFFPQLETMFEFDKDKIKPTVENSPKMIFGIKPCDLEGVLFTDEFFKRNFEDAYYLSRADKRFLVTVACLKPPRPDACFCTSAKTGPFAESGFDLQLIDNGENYLVQIGSSQGEEFVKKHGKFFKNAPSGAEGIVVELKNKAEKSIEVKVDFDAVVEKMKDEKFDPQEIYDCISERCIYCGACLYTCPTCTCFNVTDNALGKKGERVRTWDTCVYEGYTREASGHNPRKTKNLRTARRYEHKLRYDQKVANTPGCIACGRCLSSCPVKLGMSKFIEEIMQKEGSKKCLKQNAAV